MLLTTQHSRRKLLHLGLLLGSVALLAVGVLVPTPRATGETTVKVCHRPPGNPSNVQLITIGLAAVNAHKKHGDYFPLTFYQDADDDGFGTPMSTDQACSAPAGFVANNTDCDDTRAAVNPGAKEEPGNGIDDDCNPAPSDGVKCPCYGGTSGGVTWDSSFIGTSCAQVTGSLEGEVWESTPGGVGLFIGSSATRPRICAFTRVGCNCGVISANLTQEEYDACSTSLSFISKGQCPP